MPIYYSHLVGPLKGTPDPLNQPQSTVQGCCCWLLPSALDRSCYQGDLERPGSGYSSLFWLEGRLVPQHCCLSRLLFANPPGGPQLWPPALGRPPQLTQAALASTPSCGKPIPDQQQHVQEKARIVFPSFITKYQPYWLNTSRPKQIHFSLINNLKCQCPGLSDGMSSSWARCF